MPLINIEDLKNATAASLIQSLDGLIEGANADIQTFVVAISNDLAEAAATDITLVPALLNQLEVVAEANRVRLVAASIATTKAVLLGVAQFIAKITLPTIPTIP